MNKYIPLFFTALLLAFWFHGYWYANDKCNIKHEKLYKEQTERLEAIAKQKDLEMAKMQLEHKKEINKLYSNVNTKHCEKLYPQINKILGFE